MANPNNNFQDDSAITPRQNAIPLHKQNGVPGTKEESIGQASKAKVKTLANISALKQAALPKASTEVQSKISSEVETPAVTDPTEVTSTKQRDLDNLSLD